MWGSLFVPTFSFLVSVISTFLTAVLQVVSTLLMLACLGVNESNDNSYFPGLLWVLNAPSMLLLIMEPQSSIIIKWLENTSLKASYLNAEKLQEDISQEIWDKFSSQTKKLRNEASLYWLPHLPSVWTRTEQNIRIFIMYQVTCTFNFST